jgi:hypothetical protein
LLATQGIRGGANREVLKRIKETGDIFFAESDRDWVLAGASVHVSMIGFDDGSEKYRSLNGRAERVINPNLTATADVTTARQLKANLDVAFMGTTKGGAFDIAEGVALELLRAPNPHRKPNSDVVVPWVNGMDLTQRFSGTWIIDYSVRLSEANAMHYERPFEYVRKTVKPVRQKNNRETYRRLWWQHVEARPAMRSALAPLRRFLCTTRVSKYRLFVWLAAPTLPDSATFAFARADDYFFGVLHSRAHEVWARIQGTQVRERESGFRYTPTTCFETFPFPFKDDLQPPAPPHSPSPPKSKHPVLDPIQAWADADKSYFINEEPAPYGLSRKSHPMRETHRAAIAAAAKELNELRERWLNPPEWTKTRTLEFPGTVTGPWSRYVVKPDKNGLGTVRYPRLEPRDAECDLKLKDRTLTKLYNERPAWLDFAHKKLDAAVAAAYGFPAELTDEQILEKLLALNLARADEEAKAAKTKTRKVQRQKDENELV